VGAGGLGVYIFRGLRQYDNNLLIAGAGSAALIALAADFSLGVFEQHFAATGKRQSRVSAGQKIRVAAIAIIMLAAVLLSFRSSQSDRSSQSNSNAGTTGAHVVVGSKDFTESALLAEIVAQMLEARGVTVERQFELGGNLPHEALLAGRIDLYPEYTGTAYTAILHHQPISDPRAVYVQFKLDYAEKFNVEVSPPLGFENTFAILVRGEVARRLSLKTISEAAKYAPQWRAGFGQDFMSRADGYPGLSKAFGLKFAEAPHEMDLSLTYIALSSGKVDLIAGNSTDGRIAALDLVQLEDDRHYFPPYEAVLLARKDALARVPALAETLTKLRGAITTEEMRRRNYEVDGNKRDKKDVVREWLKAKGL